MSETPLGSDDRRQAMVKLPDWTDEQESISRQFKFANFAESLSFVNRVGEAAETANHHPDLAISWDTVTVRLSTHSAGGVTEADINLARGIDALV